VKIYCASCGECHELKPSEMERVIYAHQGLAKDVNRFIECAAYKLANGQFVDESDLPSCEPNPCLLHLVEPHCHDNVSAMLNRKQEGRAAYKRKL
jgi:hypothetical protein